MTAALYVMLLVSTALLLGNEFSIGFFIHPSLARIDHRRFLPAIQVFAALFGRIMPLWMPATLLVHLILLGWTWQWPASHTIYLGCAAIFWTIIIGFSVIGPVPINNRVKAWDCSHLPEDWEVQRLRWDRLNAIRVVLIALAYVALVLAFKSQDI